MLERDRIEALTNLLGDLEQDLNRSELSTGRRRQGLAPWIRAVAVLVAGLALSNLYFVNDLTDEVRLVINRMQEMTTLFSRVSARMDAMRIEVADIEQNVLLLPVVAEQMREMSAHVRVMEEAVSTMNETTARLSESVLTMDHSLRDMSVRFHGLNRSVGAMGADVDQMGRSLP
jgi:methyl-accepting chemotaxis protein